MSATLPYPEPDGTFTAGWSGSDASRDRALRERENATETQAAALRQLRLAGPVGLTWFELGEALNWHHGRASGVLSVLHHADRVSRLAERRGRSSVYVLNSYVNGRAIATPRKNRAWANGYDAGHADGYGEGYRDGREEAS